jgi:hypothetical protein
MADGANESDGEVMAYDQNVLSDTPLDLAIDAADGDLYVGPDGPAFVAGIDAVAQLALIRLRLFMEEWFMNLDAGVPWYQEFLGHKFDEALLRARITGQCLATPAVTAVIALVIEYDATTRRPAVSVQVRTQFGDTGIMTV